MSTQTTQRKLNNVDMVNEAILITKFNQAFMRQQLMRPLRKCEKTYAIQCS